MDFVIIRTKLSDMKKLLSYEAFTDMIFEEASNNEEWMKKYLKIQKGIKFLEGSIGEAKAIYDSMQPTKRGDE